MNIQHIKVDSNILQKVFTINLILQQEVISSFSHTLIISILFYFLKGSSKVSFPQIPI